MCLYLFVGCKNRKKMNYQNFKSKTYFYSCIFLCKMLILF